jgi:hypothetical protein
VAENYFVPDFFVSLKLNLIEIKIIKNYPNNSSDKNPSLNISKLKIFLI